MQLIYDKNYWQNYYDGPYDETFHYGFHLEDIYVTCWKNIYKDPPKSFADIGCGPGQTLKVAQDLFPNAQIYGLEIQQIPATDIVHPGVKFGDFLEESHKLAPVDFLYCACTMYIPWNKQAQFLEEVLRLTKKAVCFANIYLTDRDHIPDDGQRLVLYKSRPSFVQSIEATGSFKSVPGPYDFFYRV